MINQCERCGSDHIVHAENMDVCDKCFSTVVYNQDGDVVSKHITGDDFIECLESLSTPIDPFNPSGFSIIRRLVLLAPDIPTLLNVYGISLCLVNDYEASIAMLKKAVEINPTYGTALYNLGKVYEKIEDYNGMVQYLQLAEPYIKAGDNMYVDFLGDLSLGFASIGRRTRSEYFLDKAEKLGYKKGEVIRQKLNSVHNSEPVTVSNNSSSYNQKSETGGFHDNTSVADVKLDQNSKRCPKTRDEFITLIRSYAKRLEKAGIDSTLEDSNGKLTWVVEAGYMSDVRQVLVVNSFEKNGIVNCDENAIFRAPGSVNINRFKGTRDIIRCIERFTKQYEPNEEDEINFAEDARVPQISVSSSVGMQDKSLNRAKKYSNSQRGNKPNTGTNLLGKVVFLGIINALINNGGGNQGNGSSGRVSLPLTNRTIGTLTCLPSSPICATCVHWNGFSRLIKDMTGREIVEYDNQKLGKCGKFGKNRGALKGGEIGCNIWLSKYKQNR